MAAARKSSRYGHRDATMILIGYRHGLRASELCDLQWSQVELATGRLHVRRAKNGSPSVHPMQGDEIRALRRLQREQGLSSHIFMTERDGPMKKAPQRVRIPALLISGDATSPQCEVGSRAYQLFVQAGECGEISLGAGRLRAAYLEVINITNRNAQIAVTSPMVFTVVQKMTPCE